jgi:tetratricopeptide (TPR) repeat protein
MTEAAEEAVRSVLEELKDRGAKAIEAGRLEEAESLFEEALVLARDHGDPHQIDLAVCNRAAAAIERGRGAGDLPRLREILVRNADPVSCRVAAYNIARHYEQSKSFKKALFYARIACDRSETLGRRDWLATSHNLIGNTLLAESFVDEACEQYEQALELMPEAPSATRAGILCNLGYCRTLQGKHREGYRLLYESLRLLRSFQAERYEIATRLDLCFAHLETGRYQHARNQGIKAMRLAEKLDESQQLKNSLYLLGEVESLCGHTDAARAYFTQLQREFFPDASYLPGFLLAVDVRQLVNLHA